MTPPPAEELQQRFREMLIPLIEREQKTYRQAKRRERKIGWSLLFWLLFDMIWRHTPSLREETRVISQEGVWGQPAISVRPQAVIDRLRIFPTELLISIVTSFLPQVAERANSRSSPLPPILRDLSQRFPRLWAIDGSTLDAVLRKALLFRDEPVRPLAGRMIAILDIVTQLPVALASTDGATSTDQQWWNWLDEHLPKHTLILMDGGFCQYQRYAAFTSSDRYFIAPLASNAVTSVVSFRRISASVTDCVIRLGASPKATDPSYRMITLTLGGTTTRYLTNILDRKRLLAAEMIVCYEYRWKIEQAFLTVKRVLGLAYFHGSSYLAITAQVWMTWLAYCLLVDLADSVSAFVQRPRVLISLQMLLRGLYHFREACLCRHESRSLLTYLSQESFLNLFHPLTSFFGPLTRFLFSECLLDSS